MHELQSVSDQCCWIVDDMSWSLGHHTSGRTHTSYAMEEVSTTLLLIQSSESWITDATYQ